MRDEGNIHGANHREGERRASILEKIEEARTIPRVVSLDGVELPAPGPVAVPLRVRLARLILAGTGWEPMPPTLSAAMRASLWRAQYEHRRAESCPDAPSEAPAILAARRVLDPVQQIQDEIAYEALRCAVRDNAEIEFVEPEKDADGG